MIRRSRAWLALLLVLTMPLRAMAAAAMPCCPTDAAPPHAMAMAAADMPLHMHDDHMHDRGVQSGGGDHRLPSFDCCAIAMIAVPSVAVVATPYAPPFAAPLRTTPIAPFVTEAPDRPPRA